MKDVKVNVNVDHDAISKKIALLQYITTNDCTVNVKKVVYKFLNSLDLSYDDNRKLVFDVRPSPYDADSLFVSIHFNSDHDWITSQPETYIGGKHYSYYTRFETESDDYKIVFAAESSVSMPNEDYELYRMLGKIHQEIIPATIEESIYCTT